jgi:glutamate N-acetyltransferase/amino-acid N-acetyltransferase
MIEENKGITSPRGFKAAGVASGVKKGKALDLALILADGPCTAAGIFTTNRVKAHPVLDSLEKLKRSRQIQGILVNSGCANACTGPQGMKDLQRVLAGLSREVDIPVQELLMASTGVIGERLPREKVIKTLPRLISSLSTEGHEKAARAIMTTDTFPKEHAVRVETSRGLITIGGMAKGAGMINPRMATMLAFITTDAELTDRRAVRRILKEAVEVSFNRVNLDGDTSTNDTVIMLASGRSGVNPARGNLKVFSAGVEKVCQGLSRMIAADAEGATKMVLVRVTGALSDLQAERAARAVAQSPLVKTAFYGRDPNWGRIMAALGYSGAVFDPGKVTISLNGLNLVRQGRKNPLVDDGEASKGLSDPELELDIVLGKGRGRYHLWTSDLTPDFVKINADYRS